MASKEDTQIEMEPHEHHDEHHEHHDGEDPHVEHPMLKKRKFDYHPGVNVAIKGTIAALLLVFSLHLVFMYLYFGALWNIEKGFPNLAVAIVNADQPFNGVSVGSSIESVILGVQSTAKPGAPLLGWKSVSSGTSLEQLENEVFQENYWLAIYIPPDFTSNLVEGLLGMKTPYSNYFSLIYDEGRQYTTITTAKAYVTSVLTQISYSLSTRILAGEFGGPVNTSVADLSAIVTPIQVNLVNLHPVNSVGAAFSTYLGFVVMWLSCLLVINVLQKTIHPLERAGSAFWTTRMLIAVRFALGTISGSVLAIFYSAVSWGFGLRFEMGFGAHFAFCWLAACCFLSLISSIISLLGNPAVMLVTLLLYLQLVSSSAIYSADVMNIFFEKVGPIFPMYHAIQGARTICFGSANNLSLNVGILFVWMIVCIVGFSISFRYHTKKRLKAALKENPVLNNAVHAVTHAMAK